MNKQRQILIGALFLGALLILVWGLNLLKGKDVFNPRTTYYGVFDQVNGLLETNPVYLKGLKIGQVEDIALLDDSARSVMVTIQIDDDIKVPENSILKLYSSDLMGSKAISIEMGNSTVLAPNKTKLKTEIQASLQEEVNKQVAPLKLKTEALISSIDTLLISIQSVLNEKTRDNLKNSFDKISIIIDNLANTSYTIDTMMTTETNRLKRIIANVESITHNVRNSNEHIHNIIENFSSITDSIAKTNIAQTLKSTEKAMTDFALITNKINRGEGSIGQLVNNDSLYIHLESSSKNLDALLLDMKAHPNRYVHFSVFGRNPNKGK